MLGRLALFIWVGERMSLLSVGNLMMSLFPNENGSWLGL